MTAAQLPLPDVQPRGQVNQGHTVLVGSIGRSCGAGLPRPCIRDSTAAADSSETHHPSMDLAYGYPHALEMAEVQRHGLKSCSVRGLHHCLEAVVNSSTVHSTLNDDVTCVRCANKPSSMLKLL
jgi:hypothetical protein